MSTHNRTNTPAPGAKESRAPETSPVSPTSTGSTPLVAPLQAWINRETLEAIRRTTGAPPDAPAPPGESDPPPEI